jgi:hypothetical protein
MLIPARLAAPATLRVTEEVSVIKPVAVSEAVTVTTYVPATEAVNTFFAAFAGLAAEKVTLADGLLANAYVVGTLVLVPVASRRTAWPIAGLLALEPSAALIMAVVPVVIVTPADAVAGNS